MTRSLARESSWATLDTTPLNSEDSETTVSKRGSHAMKALPTLDENNSNASLGMDESTGFQASSQVTPVPGQASASKTSRREGMTRMSSWACLGIDDL